MVVTHTDMLTFKSTIAIPKICALNGMMVCHRFYEEAASTWFRVRSIECSDFDHGNLIRASKLIQRNIVSFGFEWQRRLDRCAELKLCAKLRKLRIVVSDRVFDMFEDRLCFVHDFKDDDFFTMKMVQDILDIATIERVEVVPAEPNVISLAQTDEEVAQWHKNVTALQTCVNREIDRVWEEEEAYIENQGYQPEEIVKAPVENSLSDKAVRKLCKSVKKAAKKLDGSTKASTSGKVTLVVKEAKKVQGSTSSTEVLLSGSRDKMSENINHSGKHGMIDIDLSRSPEGPVDNRESGETHDGTPNMTIHEPAKVLAQKQMLQDLSIQDSHYSVVLCFAALMLICSISNSVSLWVLASKL